MIINIVAGGPLDIDLVKAHPADLTIGVDYGAYQLINNNMTLDVAFGDFDSINTYQLVELLNTCSKVNKYKKDKDNTDTELAFSYALELKPDVIQLFGVTGKRIDHFLSVLYLFKKVLSCNVKLIIIDEYNKIYIKKPGVHHIKKSEYHYLSFFAYQDEVVNLTLTNFKYKLDNYLLKNQDSLCISNELISDVGIVSFDKGILLIVESRD
ncbi:thiamine diphosphokinase [Mycoplasmatota bacterium]|nr:thiamine diphosphokinase [Mycoplasmatota bacterium]